jgi:threonine synthase
VVATAHPAKFPEAVQAATGQTPALPAELQALQDRPLVVRDIAVGGDLGWMSL